MKLNHTYYLLIFGLLLGTQPGCKQSITHHGPHHFTDGDLYPEIPEAHVEQKPALDHNAIPNELPKGPAVGEQTLPIAEKNEAPGQPKVTKKDSDEASVNRNELDFDVENKTGKTVYVTAFVWIHRRDFGHWHWEKSDIYQLDPDATTTIDIKTVPMQEDRSRVFGYLAVFNNRQEADDATIELTNERHLLDLDLLIKLKGKKVTLSVERYGRKKGKDYEYYEYDFVPKDGPEAVLPSLDFAVENNTGKTILITCFVYQKKAKGKWIEGTGEKRERDDVTVWHFAKTPLIKLVPHQVGIVDVGSVTSSYDRKYVRGYLAVFDEDEEEKALNATFELLPSKYKLAIGELDRLKNQKVVLEVDTYGMQPKFIEYVPKPMGHIDFTKLYGTKKQSFEPINQ
jgi:hypothetical protein